MKLYVASSLRNRHYRSIISKLRGIGHEVYDFGDPPAGVGEFGILPELRPDEHFDALCSSVGLATFKRDSNALRDCDGCVLVLPCGRSAHMEAGYTVGQGKPLAIYLEPHKAQEPEVMYNFGTLVWNEQMLKDWLARIERGQRPLHYVMSTMGAYGQGLASGWKAHVQD